MLITASKCIESVRWSRGKKEEKEKLPYRKAMSLIDMRIVRVTTELQVIVLFWKGNSLGLR